MVDKSFDLSIIESNIKGNQQKRRYDLDLEFKYPIRPLRSPLDKINQIYSTNKAFNVNINCMSELERREEALKLLKSKH